MFAWLACDPGNEPGVRNRKIFLIPSRRSLLARNDDPVESQLLRFRVADGVTPIFWR